MKNVLLELNIFCIFIFFLIVSANFLAEIFPCRLQDIIRNNMFVKHIFGIFTMIFFVVLSSGTKDKNILNISKKSFLLYILFILMTKCQINIFCVILFFLGVTYILHLIKQEKLEEEDKNKDEIAIYNNIIDGLYILILFFTIIGVLLYIGEKKIEYGNNFNYITFFIGKTICKGKSPKVNMLKSLKYAFK